MKLYNANICTWTKINNYSLHLIPFYFEKFSAKNKNLRIVKNSYVWNNLSVKIIHAQGLNNEVVIFW